MGCSQSLLQLSLYPNDSTNQLSQKITTFGSANSRQMMMKPEKKDHHQEQSHNFIYGDNHIEEKEDDINGNINSYMYGGDGDKEDIDHVVDDIESIQSFSLDQSSQSKFIQNVIHEILVTEQTYVQNMNLTYQKYIKPLKDSIILDSETLLDQFNDYEMIKKLHELFLDELLTQQQQQHIGSNHHKTNNHLVIIKLLQLFHQYIPMMKMYQNYLQNYTTRQLIRYQLIQNNTLFKDFIGDIHELESLLVEPVQRLPRYKLLIEKLSQNIPQSNPAYHQSLEALKRIEEITIHNNKAIEEMERKKIQMKCMLTIWNKTGIQIVEPHRLLIKEGTLMNTHNPTSLQIWLFNDIIICGMMPITRKSSNHDVLSCKDTYFFGTPLHLCQITSHPSDLSYGNTTSLNMNDCTFLFESQCPKDSFLIITKSSEEKKEWIDALQSAQELRKLTKIDSYQQDYYISISEYCLLCSKLFLKSDSSSIRYTCTQCHRAICHFCSTEYINSTTNILSYNCKICQKYLYWISSSSTSSMNSQFLQCLGDLEIILQPLQQDILLLVSKRRKSLDLYMRIEFQDNKYDSNRLSYILHHESKFVFPYYGIRASSGTTTSGIRPRSGTTTSGIRPRSGTTTSGSGGNTSSSSINTLAIDTSLQFTLYHRQLFIDDFLGIATIDLSTALSSSTTTIEGQEFDLPLEPSGTGNIQFKLRILPNLLTRNSINTS